MTCETVFCPTCQKSRRIESGTSADCPEGHGPMRSRQPEPEETDTIKALDQKWRDPYASRV